MLLRPNRWTARILLVVTAFTLCGGVELAQAQQSSTIPATPPAAQAGNQQSTGKVDPAKGPLAPVPSRPDEASPLPEAPTPMPDASSADQRPVDMPKRQKRVEPPAGVGAAQAGPSVGGAASKPAGNAIAPAKQKQYRSLLIKIGAIAGAGIAIGTVTALTRGTSSKPPGAK